MAGWGDSLKNNPVSEYLGSQKKYLKMKWDNLMNDINNRFSGAYYDQMDARRKAEMNNVDMALEQQKMKDLSQSRLGNTPNYTQGAAGEYDMVDEAGAKNMGMTVPEYLDYKRRMNGGATQPVNQGPTPPTTSRFNTPGNITDMLVNSLGTALGFTGRTQRIDKEMERY